MREINVASYGATMVQETCDKTVRYKGQVGKSLYRYTTSTCRQHTHTNKPHTAIANSFHSLLLSSTSLLLFTTRATHGYIEKSQPTLRLRLRFAPTQGGVYMYMLTYSCLCSRRIALDQFPFHPSQCTSICGCTSLLLLLQLLLLLILSSTNPRLENKTGKGGLVTEHTRKRGKRGKGKHVLD